MASDQFVLGTFAGASFLWLARLLIDLVIAEHDRQMRRKWRDQ